MNEKNRLFVGNLPYSVKDEQLAEIFRGIEGLEVVKAEVVLDKNKNDGYSKGFGFVTLANEEMAKMAIEKVNGMEVEGRKLFADFARERQERRDDSQAAA